MALALNVPASVVLSRRAILKLRKVSPKSTDIIVWCERNDFEKDLAEYRLLKARPDVIL